MPQRGRLLTPVQLDRTRDKRDKHVVGMPVVGVLVVAAVESRA